MRFLLAILTIVFVQLLNSQFHVAYLKAIQVISLECYDFQSICVQEDRTAQYNMGI